MFLERKEELTILDNRYASNRFEFGYLYGPRRIGKTSLLDAFCQGKKHLFFQAFDQSDELNLRDMSHLLQKELGRNAALEYPDWFSFFDDVLAYFGNDKGVLVIDEYPNLVLTKEGKSRNNGFASKLQNIIDHRFSKTQITFVLTGSNVSFMRELVQDSHDPLYERKTFELELGPLRFSESAAFVKETSLPLKARFLALTGGYPYYLSLLNPKASLEDNLTRFFYARDATFLDAPGEVLSTSHHSPLYQSILFSLVSGKRTIREIAADLKEDSAHIASCVSDLEQDDVLEKKIMFNSERKTSYSIRDPLLSFWYTFIAKNQDKIRLGYGSLLQASQKNAIEEFFDHGFENVANTYLEELGRAGKLGGLFYPISHLQIDNSELGRSVEIDGLAQDGNALLVVESKFTLKKRSLADYHHLQESLSLKMFSSCARREFYLVSASGFEENLLTLKDPHCHLIDLTTMFAESSN